MNALEIKNLSKYFPDFHIKDLNLVLPSGCIMGLLGENGAGKSTIIKLILDLIQKTDGSITILGKDQQKELHLTKQDIGVVLDDVAFPSYLQLNEIKKILQYSYGNWDEEAFQTLAARFELPKNKAFKTFSKGMKMKLGFAIALSHHAKLLILDEATAGLDPLARDLVVELLTEFTRQEDHSVLISSHIVSDLERLCDYVAIVHQGELLLCEEKDQLLAQYGILRGTVEELKAYTPLAISMRETSYGSELILPRAAVPKDQALSPVSLEELFVAMIKEAKK